MDCVCNVLVLHVICFFIIPALAELRESGLLSAEETEEVVQAYYYSGKVRLIEIVFSKETDVITQTVSLLDKHSLPEMSSVLKGVFCVGGVHCIM